MNIAASSVESTNLHIVDVMTVPRGIEKLVSEPENEDVLNHLLTQVVVNSVDLLLLPVRLQSFLQLPRALKILAERLLNLHKKIVLFLLCLECGDDRTYDNPGIALLGVAVLLQLFRYGNENAGRQGHVEDAIILLLALFEFLQVSVEVDEGLILVVLAGDVRADFAELLQLLLDLFGGHFDVRLDSSQKLCVVHLCPGIADNLNIFREEFVAVLGGASALLLPSIGEPRNLPNRTALGTAAPVLLAC